MCARNTNLELNMDLGVEICRFCMAKDNLINIFNTCDELTMEFKASHCNLINIEEDGDLPRYVCKVCKFKIHFFYEFKKQCEMTKLKLKEMLESTEFKYEVQIKCEVDDNKDVKCDFDDICEYDSVSAKDDENVDDLIDLDKFKHKKYKNKKDRANKKRFKSKRMKFGSNVDVVNAPVTINYNKSENCDAKPFQCELCGQTFRLKSVLKKHMNTHTNEKLFGCPICPKRYTREEHRVVHMRMHAGCKPYVCEICARPFTKNQDLIRHKKIHSDEKKYSCSRCDKKFKRSGDVHTHMRTHTGLKPFKCLDCFKTYASRSGLKKHIYKSQCKKYPDMKCIEKNDAVIEISIENKVVL